MIYRNVDTDTLGMIHFEITNIFWGNFLNVAADTSLIAVCYLMGFWLFYEHILAKPNPNK